MSGKEVWSGSGRSERLSCRRWREGGKRNFFYTEFRFWFSEKKVVVRILEFCCRRESKSNPGDHVDQITWALVSGSVLRSVGQSITSNSSDPLQEAAVWGCSRGMLWDR